MSLLQLERSPSGDYSLIAAALLVGGVSVLDLLLPRQPTW